MARQAARGAGLPWGLADEAGRAVRELCAAGVDGCAALAHLLGDLRARRHHSPAPAHLLDRVWAAPGGALCPIRTGTALSDMARALPPDGVGLVGVIRPILILPFAVDVARRLDATVTLSWHSGILSCGPDGVPPSDVIVRLALIRQTGLHLHPGGPNTPAAPRHGRARPDADAWAALVISAGRCFAPREDPG